VDSCRALANNHRNVILTWTDIADLKIEGRGNPEVARALQSIPRRGSDSLKDRRAFAALR
jgi:hypothetical protein